MGGSPELAGLVGCMARHGVCTAAAALLAWAPAGPSGVPGGTTGALFASSTIPKTAPASALLPAAPCTAGLPPAAGRPEPHLQGSAARRPARLLRHLGLRGACPRPGGCAPRRQRAGGGAAVRACVGRRPRAGSTPARRRSLPQRAARVVDRSCVPCPAALPLPRPCPMQASARCLRPRQPLRAACRAHLPPACLLPCCPAPPPAGINRVSGSYRRDAQLAQRLHVTFDSERAPGAARCVREGRPDDAWPRGAAWGRALAQGRCRALLQVVDRPPFRQPASCRQSPHCPSPCPALQRSR